jgi:serine phosphatase RsbU (regulator of sigma subunit)
MTLELVLATAYFTCGALMLFLGFVVLRENPAQRVNRAIAAMLVFGGLGPILGAYENLLGGQAVEAGAIQDVFARFAFLWEFFFPATLAFALVFPKLNVWMRRIPRLSLLLFIPHVAHVGLAIVAGGSGALPWPAWLETAPVIGPFAGVLKVGFELLLDVHVRFFSFVNFLMAATSVVLLWRSARATTSPKLRSQLYTIQRGLGFGLGLYSGGDLIPAMLGTPLARTISVPLITVSLMVGAVSIVLAIVRLGFLDLRFIVRRGLVYGLASGVIVAVYLFIGKQIDKATAGLVGEQLPVFETTFLVLSLFLLQPVLAGIERLVDRGYARDRTDLRNALGRLSEDVAARLDPDDMARILAESLRRELVLRSAAVVLRDRRSGIFTLTRAGSGTGVEPSWPIGRLVFEAMRGRKDPVSARELAEAPEEADERRAVADALAGLGVAHAIALRGSAADGRSRSDEATAEDEAAGNGSSDDVEAAPPAADDGGLVGVLFVGEKETETRMPFEELSLLLLFTRQVGISLQNAALHEERMEVRLIQEEVATARSIQEQLLPESPPELSGWDLCASNRPSRHVGGDYHDFLPLPGGEVGIAIGDVSGKGVPAALLMSNLQAALRGRVLSGNPIERTVEDVNRQICRNTGAESFISFFLGELQPRSGTLHYTNAGHNAPVLVRADGAVETLDDGGLLLGVFPEATYEKGSVDLGPGDLLALYTDGVTEASNPEGEMFGEELLVESLLRHRKSGAGELHRLVLEEVERFQRGKAPDDDLTLIVLKRAGVADEKPADGAMAAAASAGGAS